MVHYGLGENGELALWYLQSTELCILLNVKLQYSTLIKPKVFGFNLYGNTPNPKWKLTFLSQCLTFITYFQWFILSNLVRIPYE